MAKGVCAAVVAGVLLLPAAVSAKEAPQQFVGGNTVADACGRGVDPCGSYILGVVDAHQALVAFGKIKKSFCLGPDATDKQIVDAVWQYFQSHPDQRNFGAGGTVLIALGEAFPCR